jgi:hypothetical protein
VDNPLLGGERRFRSAVIGMSGRAKHCE